MDDKKLWNFALFLAVFTVFYNIAEGVIAVWLGYSDDTLSLFGFGLDSFAECFSGIGIWHLVIRQKKSFDESGRFERNALKITGFSFYILAAVLLITGIINIIEGKQPESTFWGIVISVISLLIMWALLKSKIYVGTKLKSDAMIADGNCTKTCMYMSVILLSSSLLYEVFNVMYIDAIGAIALAFYSFKEGKESFEKAKGKACACHTKG